MKDSKNILDFPGELIKEIFSYLTIIERMQKKSTSKRWKALCEDTPDKEYYPKLKQAPWGMHLLATAVKYNSDLSFEALYKIGCSLEKIYWDTYPEGKWEVPVKKPDFFSAIERACCKGAVANLSAKLNKKNPDLSTSLIKLLVLCLQDKVHGKEKFKLVFKFFCERNSIESIVGILMEPHNHHVLVKIFSYKLFNAIKLTYGGSFLGFMCMCCKLWDMRVIGVLALYLTYSPDNLKKFTISLEKLLEAGDAIFECIKILRPLCPISIDKKDWFLRDIPQFQRLAQKIFRVSPGEYRFFENGMTLLHYSISLDMGCLKYILELSSDNINFISTRDYEDNTFLHYAMKNKRYSTERMLLVKKILEKIIVIHPGFADLLNKDGLAALHIAALKCDSNMLDFLINNGADINVINKAGETALKILMDINYDEYNITDEGILVPRESFPIHVTIL